MSLIAVVKVGGSLSRGTGLPALCREISHLSRGHALLIVPGGGDFADQVRLADQRFHLGDTTAHQMALLAMDQYGYLLHRLIPDSAATPDLQTALQFAETGRAAILLPSDLIMKSDPLPHSWAVTSDSIAAWIAGRSGSHRLILLKDVDGLLRSNTLIEDLTVGQLEKHIGGVDEYLATILSLVRIETWIVDGLHPDRLAELLEVGHTKGTRIANTKSSGIP